MTKPYFLPDQYSMKVKMDKLEEQLAKANECIKECHKELVSRHTAITELEQANNEYAILIANLVRRADVKSDLYENPTYEKASETLNKFAIENKIEGVKWFSEQYCDDEHWFLADKAIEQLRKEQSQC